MICQHCGYNLGPLNIDHFRSCVASGQEFYGTIFAEQCSNCGEHNEIVVAVKGIGWPFKLIQL